MDSSEVIDWEGTSPNERKQLHKPVKAVKRRLGMTWPAVFLDAFGLRDNVGEGYEDNLRKGKIGPEKAFKLFLWLHEHDSVLASDVEDIILALRSAANPETPQSWENLLSKGEFSNIEIFKISDENSLTNFARREPIQSIKLKFLDEFYFEMVFPFDGTLIAFEGYRGRWYPLPIANNSAVLEVVSGRQIIPTGENGKPDPLWEDKDQGKHSYAFLLVEENHLADAAPKLPARALPAKQRDEIAERLFVNPAVSWRLFRTNLMFGRT